MGNSFVKSFSIMFLISKQKS